jgi:hypothetical protein
VGAGRRERASRRRLWSRRRARSGCRSPARVGRHGGTIRMGVDSCLGRAESHARVPDRSGSGRNADSTKRHAWPAVSASRPARRRSVATSAHSLVRHGDCCQRAQGRLRAMSNAADPNAACQV